MELGGKASAVVLEDADIELAANECALGAFYHVCYPPTPWYSMHIAMELTFLPLERPNLHGY